MSRALLDVNLLVALLDSDHVHHVQAQEWQATELRDGWASCALTELGFLRVISQPRYPNPVSPAVAAERLSFACATDAHALWLCSASPLDVIALDRVHSAAQLTDAYLLALAVAHDGTLATLDRRIVLSSVPGAQPHHLTVL